MSDQNSHFTLNPSGSAFPQSGQWNMLELSKLPVEATLGVLSRYSAGRVNPYTALVGEVLCQNFRLPFVGRKNVDTAVEKLKVVGTLGNTLEFGFGVQDVIRSMVKTERGCVCLALCAALKECYSDDISIEVLLEMARRINVDGQYMPSSRSWRELLAACAGALSATRFPTLAEVFMQHPDTEERLGAFRRIVAAPASLRSCSRPASLAEAIFGLARISRGELQSITLYGGSDAGWLAALAEWLLDMNVKIINFEGELYYTNAESEDDNIQVTVVMRTRQDEIARDILAAETTFVLNDMTKLFDKDAQYQGDMVVSGRVKWENALHSTFLSDFKRLMEIQYTLASCLGSAARLFKGIAQAEEAFAARYRRACISYSEASYGSGFVFNVIRWFPELRGLKDEMLKNVSQTLDSARRNYEAGISTIRAHCNCITCQSKNVGHDLGQLDSENDTIMTPAFSESEAPLAESELDNDDDDDDEDDEDESVDEWDPDKFCEVVMLETILTLSKTLSTVKLKDEDLLPTRSGLELAYGRQLNNRLSAPSGYSALRDIGPIAFVLDFDSNFSIGESFHNEDAVEVRLHRALELFAGREPLWTRSNYSAVTANGMCAYLDILTDKNVLPESIESAAMINILPGRIYHEKKTYEELTDLVSTVPSRTSGFARAAEIRGIERHRLNVGLWVHESYTGLEVKMNITFRPGRDGSNFPDITAGPSRLVSWLVSRQGLVTCNKIHRKLSRLALDRQKECAAPAGISMAKVRDAAVNQTPFHLNDKVIRVLPYRDVAIAIAAVASTLELDPEYSIFVVGQECLSCCMRAVLMMDGPERTHFAIFQVPI